jgi:hypothetical protein
VTKTLPAAVELTVLPAIKTLPSQSRVAECPLRGVVMLPVAANVPIDCATATLDNRKRAAASAFINRRIVVLASFYSRNDSNCKDPATVGPGIQRVFIVRVKRQRTYGCHRQP